MIFHARTFSVLIAAKMRFTRAFIGAFAVAALCGCGRAPVSKQSPLPENAVARVGSEIITVSDFQEEIRTRPVTNDRAGRTALLDEMIEFRALVQDAKARGYERDPKVQRAFARILANKMRTELETGAQSPPEITQEEIESSYRKREKEFVLPAKIRAAMIFVEAPATFTDEKRAERRARVEQARSQALEQITTINNKQAGLGALAAEYSYDQATKYRGGDLGYLLEGLTGRGVDALEPAVLQACFALREVGQVSEIVQTPTGYYVLKLLERQPASVRPLSTVRNEIISRLRQEKSEQIKKSFAAQVRAGKQIEVRSDRIANIPVPEPRRVSNRESEKPPALPDMEK